MMKNLWLKFLVLSRNSVGQGLDNPLLVCVNCHCRPSVVMAGLVAGFPLLPRGSLEGAGFLSRAGPWEQY